jgi:hypothetical protein
MKEQVKHVKIQCNCLRARAVWLWCVLVGLGGMSIVVAECLYDEQPGYRVCAWDGDCGSYTLPTARTCLRLTYGVMEFGSTVTNKVTQSTYSNGTCGDYSKCSGGTLVSQTPNVELKETLCAHCGG